jgi:hypothetical protein
MPTSTLGRYLAYFYFLRFSLLLWLTMPIFAVLDAYSGISTATRGILTLENSGQFGWAAFFVVIAGWVALLSARVVCAYGEERFGAAPPKRFEVAENMSPGVFLGAQAPGAILLAYCFAVSVCDGGESWHRVAGWMLLGVAFAVVCWYLLAAFYYLTYETDDRLVEKKKMKPEERDARREKRLRTERKAGLKFDPRVEAKAFVAPLLGISWVVDLQNQSPPAIAEIFERLFSWVARRFGPGFCKGTAAAPGRPYALNSGQQVAIVTFVFLLFVYGSLCYFTAPVEMPNFRLAVRILVSVVVLAWLALAIVYRGGLKGFANAWRSTALALAILAPVWFFDLLLLWGKQTKHGFPVLAMVYMLLIFAFWGLGGLAFVFDRARIPVLTMLLAAEIAVHILTMLAGPLDWQVEHIVQTRPRCVAALHTPDEILKRFQRTRPAFQGQHAPLVVVTATGGGIHSALWTTKVLGLMEDAFAGDPNIQQWNKEHPESPASFHDSVLLMSSASGGSVGLDSWLREYRAPRPFAEPLVTEAQITQTAGCSSLEAVAWGLIYPDALHVLLPYRVWENYDRGWALQAAVDRNRFDNHDCRVPLHGLPAQLGLADMAAAIDDAKRPLVPAFSLNTTVAETGDRLLLANYYVPFSKLPTSDFLAADSFLRVYGGGGEPAQDLPLSGAARLSATFPYISPMPRVPRTVAERAYHFGDGGYFDNDGTSSAIEFLLAAYCPALAGPEASRAHCDPPATPAAKPAAIHASSEPSPKDNILLIEIRDGENPYANDRLDQGTNQGGAGLWGVLDQITGPPATSLRAGFNSVTRRNRREMCALENALGSKVNLKHYVFDYYAPTTGKLCCSAKEEQAVEPHWWSVLLPKKADQPLNWKLTRADKAEIDAVAKATSELLRDKDGNPKKDGLPIGARAAKEFGLALTDGAAFPDASECQTAFRDPKR